MNELRTHCLSQIKKVFDETDWTIIDDFNDRLNQTIIDVDIAERIRIYKIISPTWKTELLKMPEIMEKSIYNTTIKEARSKAVERSWSSTGFKWLYKKNYMKIMGNINYNKNADFVLNKINSKNSIKFEEPDMAAFNLIPHLFWKDEQNNFLENILHLTIGGSGVFTCDLIRHINILKPKSIFPTSLSTKIA